MADTKALVASIVKGVQDKKGSGIVIVDLRKIDGAITKYFVICQGNSPTQVEAIAGAVADTVREELKEKPTAVVGLGTNQWVAIDFVDVMVHVFLPELREYYDLEHLWADAEQERIADLD